MTSPLVPECATLSPRLVAASRGPPLLLTSGRARRSPCTAPFASRLHLSALQKPATSTYRPPYVHLWLHRCLPDASSCTIGAEDRGGDGASSHVRDGGGARFACPCGPWRMWGGGAGVQVGNRRDGTHTGVFRMARDRARTCETGAALDYACTSAQHHVQIREHLRLFTRMFDT